MKKILSLSLTLVLILSSFTSYADQVWGDAVEVLGSNHDQFIELTVKEGQSWEANLNVYIYKSGQAVVFPVSGIVQYNPSIFVSKASWSVNSYDLPDSIVASKLENKVGIYNYDVVFQANTELNALSKSFDKISIKVNVLAADDNVSTPIDTTAPIIVAPEDLSLEASAILTPVNLGLPVVDDATAVVTNNGLDAYPLGVTTVEWLATDASGNIGKDQQIITISDTTAPVFTQVPSNKIVLYEGQSTMVKLESPIAFDIFPVTISNNAPEIGFPVGATTVTWTALDANGNAATVQQVITVQYKFNGFLQPINLDGSSIFKLGSTIPVKFKLTDAYGNNVSSAIANIYFTKVTDQVVGSVLEATSTSASSSGNQFRYDLVDQQYIYNLSTKPMSKGSYNLIVKLDDGTTYSVLVSIK
jgi:hypothetical protein